MSDSKYLKAGIWYTISSFLIKSISFITTPIFTRILTKNEIGIFSVTTTWISILSVILSLNLYDTVILAMYDYKDEKQFKEYLSTITILGTATSAIFYAVVIMFQTQFSKFIGIPIYALHLVMIYVIFYPCTLILLSKYRVEMKYGKAVGVSLISSISSAVISVICVCSWEDGLKGRFVGTYLPAIIINIILFFLLVLQGKSFKLPYCKYALPLALPMVFHYLSGTVMSVSDRIMIQKMCSNEEVSLYTLAYTCAMFVDIIRNSLNSAWDPWVFERLNNGKENIIQKYTQYYLIFFIIICIDLMLFAPEILLILGGSDYIEAKYVIPPVILSYIFCMIYSLYSCLERYAKQQKWFAIFTFICAVVNLILNIIFIPIFGYLAAAYTTLISYILSSVLHYRHTRSIGLSVIYNNRSIMWTVIFSCLMTIVILMSYLNTLFRLMLIGCTFIGTILFIIFKREYLFFVYRQMKKS